MSKVELVDGTLVESGGPEDRATWLTCEYCQHTGPFVGHNKAGKPACMASCGGVTENPNMPKTPGARERKPLEPPVVDRPEHRTLGKRPDADRPEHRLAFELASLVYGCELQQKHAEAETFITENEQALARKIADGVDRLASRDVSVATKITFGVAARYVRNNFGGVK